MCYMNAINLSSKPTLTWEGFDVIGQKARIEGDGTTGFACSYFDEDGQIWRAPRDLDEYRWIVEAFLTECFF